MRARNWHRLEAATNLILGYLINLVLLQLVFHAMGYPVTVQDNALWGIVAMVGSFFRTYFIRRYFNRKIGQQYGNLNE